MSIQSNITETNPNTCLSCMGKLIFDLEKNEKICSNCGIVTEHDSDHHSGYDLEHSSNNEPTSSMMYDISLSTLIDKKNVDASGKQIHGGFEMEKLRRLNKFTISNDSKIRNLNKAMADIRRITGILGFGNLIAERASYIYRKALNKDLIRGRSITGISVAAIYIACKDMGVSFPIDKINEYVENSQQKDNGSLLQIFAQTDEDECKHTRTFTKHIKDCSKSKFERQNPEKSTRHLIQSWR